MRLSLLLAAKKAIVIPYELPSHRRIVQSLYKRMARNLESFYEDLPDARYEVCVLRSKFDQHKNETDIVKIRKLIETAEKELFETQHPAPKIFPTSPEGVAYERELPVPDWVVDYYHPLEKKMYPTYFKTREERKKQFVAWWEKQYGGGKTEGAGH